MNINEKVPKFKKRKKPDPEWVEDRRTRTEISQLRADVWNYVANNSGKVRVMDIVEGLKVTKSTASYYADWLVENGYLRVSALNKTKAVRPARIFATTTKKYEVVKERDDEGEVIVKSVDSPYATVYKLSNRKEHPPRTRRKSESGTFIRSTMSLFEGV